MTPKEDLFLEVLAARTRLGEPFWTFENRHIATARTLEHAGLVTIMHGVVERTFRAALTPKGRAEHTDPDYVPPILRDQESTAAEPPPPAWGHHEAMLSPGSAVVNHEGTLYWLTDHPPTRLPFVARRTLVARLRAIADVIESGEDPS